MTILILAAWASPAGAGPDEIIHQATQKLSELERSARTATQIGRLHEKIGDAERSRGSHAKAVRPYLRAVDAYALALDSKSRDRLLKRLSRPGRSWSKQKAAGFARLLEVWKKVDSIRKRLQKKPRRAEPPDDIDADLFELDGEVREIQTGADRLRNKTLRATGIELEALVLAAGGYPDDELKKYREASEACRPGCPLLRLRLLGITAHLLERRGRIEEAYKLLAVANAEANAHLPPDRKRYLRSAEMDRVCRKARSSCVLLEKQAVGYATFRDHSLGPERPALTKADMKRVHDEYIPLLHDCLRQAARSGDAERGDTFEVFWAVRNDGRTDRFQCTPSVDDLALGDCLRNALSVFRYPRYRGERKTVTVPLRVH